MAAAQFATTGDVGENLAVCLEMIDRAADTGARLIVLPEFCNHRSVYDDAEHCRRTAVALDGEFVASCARRARARGACVVLSVTLRRPEGVTVTSLLLDPAGRVAAQADKQTLMGGERAHLRPGPHVAPVAETPFGPIGMYSCMDGVTCEVPRAMAVGGARILANSLNSFALDEASLHVPARAFESQVFVVAANKVGPLAPADRVEAIAGSLGVPAEALHGAGESQIVAPDGTVVSRAPRTGRCVVSARIDLAEVERARACCPPPARRPALYAALAAPGAGSPSASAAERLLVTAAAEPRGADAALAARARLVVLPELARPPADIPEGATFAFTRRDGDRHLGVVADSSGVLLEQPQLHRTPRLPWARGAGDGLRTADLAWGRLAVVVGDDIRLPEAVRLAAVQGAAVIAVCHRPVCSADVELGLVERAAENRLCAVAAAPGSGPVAGCALISPPADSLWSRERSQPFDGTINMPDVQRIAPGQDALTGVIWPRRARQREISFQTNLVDGRCLAAAARLAGAC